MTHSLCHRVLELPHPSHCVSKLGNMSFVPSGLHCGSW